MSYASYLACINDMQHMICTIFRGYNNGDYDMWRVGREQTIEVRDPKTEQSLN